LDCSQLSKIELNGSSPINDTTKTHAIYECYCIISHLDHYGRRFCEFLSPCRLVQSDTNLLPSVLVRVAHSVMFVNQLVASALSNFKCLLMLWFGVGLLSNVLNVEFWWQSDWPVHQLWPPPECKQRTELDVVLFHGLQLTPNDTIDAWSTTWTQRDNDYVCWPRDWLPFDLGEAVRIFSVSYNVHVYDNV
jgi:hypothetical protein